MSAARWYLPIGMIIYLTKVSFFGIILIMKSKCHPFFSLEAAREARNCFRKSLLMLASNFLVGTCFNASRRSLIPMMGELL